MKALMLHSENSAVGKYRIWQPAKYLKQIGWDVVTIPDNPKRIPVDKGYSGPDLELQESARTVGSWEEMGEGIDIIVMQRPDNVDSIALAMALRDQFNVPLVFEVDDNIYDIAENSTQYQYWYPGSPLREVAELMMFQADAITVSTPALVDVYKHLNPNIYVLPNYQDPEDWKGVKAKHSDQVVIGWQGSSTHYDDLRLIRRPLKKLLRNHKNVVFRLVGYGLDFLKDVERVEYVESWAPVREFPKKLASLGFDIGIAPVVQRPFNEAKSNIKWQEYSMLGIPTVASNVGEYKQIEHGVNGFLADSEEAWYAHLEKLVLDAQLRKTIGDTAKQYTTEHNTMPLNVNKWDEAYRQIIKTR